MANANIQELTENMASDTAILVLPPGPCELARNEFVKIAEGKGNNELLKFYRNGIPKGTPKSDVRGYFVTICRGIALALEDTDITMINTIFKGSKCCPDYWDNADLNHPGTFGYNVISDSLNTIMISETAQINKGLSMTSMFEVIEKNPDWLVQGYIPKFQITTLAGSGGSGKTTVWCAIAAALSAGKHPFLLDGQHPADSVKGRPQKVVFFSAEDSFEYTLKRRLRKNGAQLENIFSIDIADDRFKNIKFNERFLEDIIAQHRPDLVIFDPIQAFVPPDIHLGDRNAVRACLSPLIGYGEKYGTTFLIVVHANKMAGVWGKKRIADSADIWDLSRSVIMAGETAEAGVRYLTHEKSNYSLTASTVLYRIDDEVVEFNGYSEKKDRDFILAEGFATRQAPAKDSAREFILDFLKDGEKSAEELDGTARAMSISKSAINRAKSELKKEGLIKRRTESGDKKGVHVFFSLSGNFLSYSHEINEKMS